MPDMRLSDTGREFEQRALAIARAIHDPSGTQGAFMFRGREHDGVFVDDRTIVAFEFTQLKTKEKAARDAEKVRDILLHLNSLGENRYKLAQGYVVTMNEPTAEQRRAVDTVGAQSRVAIKCLSVVALRSLLIDTERYLALRREAPFGSAGYQLPRTGQNIAKFGYIEPVIANRNASESLSLDDCIELVEAGERFVLTADYGVGKSEALRQLFERLRRRYFKEPTQYRFPLHINLRECYGLRTPREVLRRHCEEIGFPDENSLISAWRSGSCTLLLDGFDELVPARWVGGARDLRQVRWQALEPVRRLVADTPEASGIIVAGRAQYFSGDAELLETLSLVGRRVLLLADFDLAQIRSFLGTHGPIPDWLPAKPLLLKFLIQNELLSTLATATANATVAEAWRSMLDIIAGREAERVGSITRQTIRYLIARIATLARASAGRLGPLSMDDMRSAFREVCGYEADEEGLQLLLRLPGLANSTTSEASGSVESRSFVDISLAEVAYGEDLARYISSPYDERHPLGRGVSWTSGSGPLAAAVVDAQLRSEQFEPRVVLAAMKRRLEQNLYDAVLLDVVQVADMMGTTPSAGMSAFFNEVLIDNLTLFGEDDCLSRSTFKECVIESIDVSDVDLDGSYVPTFQRCIIGKVFGWSKMPPKFAANFMQTEVIELSSDSQTTFGIMGLSISVDSRIALVILRKVYEQAGSGRRESALPRGLPLAERARVPAVTSKLVSAGYLIRTAGRGEKLLIPVKACRAEVSGFLAAPRSFSLENLIPR